MYEQQITGKALWIGWAIGIAAVAVVIILRLLR